MENCCDSLLKYLIFIVNFLFFVTGVILIGVGAYVQTSMDNYLNFLDDDFLKVSVILIVLGVIVVIIGFCGCCGAVTENACMMFTFSSLLAIIVLAEIAVAIAAYFFYGPAAASIIQDKMISGMTNYNKSDEFSGVTKTWDAIQIDFMCCGVSNYTNWRDTDYSSKTKEGVPDSCCLEQTEGCGEGVLNRANPEQKVHTAGCVARLQEMVEGNAKTVGGVAVGVVILQIIGVLVSCMLASNMKRKANYV